MQFCDLHIFAVLKIAWHRGNSHTLERPSESELCPFRLGLVVVSGQENPEAGFFDVRPCLKMFLSRLLHKLKKGNIFSSWGFSRLFIFTLQIVY